MSTYYININILHYFVHHYCYKSSICLDYYQNNDIDNDDIVLYFHDSNMMYPLVKRLFSSHFKHNYFIWLTYDQKVIDIIKPKIIIEETMERFMNTYRIL